MLTSNRDEKTHRATLHPKTYLIGQESVTFPKDEIAGGTWIALGDNGIFCCLLNGGFKLHEWKGNYRRSRGQILLDVFRADSTEKFLKEIDLDNIEPFTLIIYNSVSDKLNLLVWDGNQRHISDLNVNEPHFWASATLYSSDVKTARKEQFFNFMSSSSEHSAKSIYHLHSSPKESNGYILNDRGGIETVSVTQLILSNLKGMMIYNDLIAETQTIVEKEWNKVLL